MTDPPPGASRQVCGIGEREIGDETRPVMLVGVAQFPAGSGTMSGSARPRDAPIATAKARHLSPQRMIRWRCHFDLARIFSSSFV